MNFYQPPLAITSRMIHQISTISEQIGRIDGQNLNLSPLLRKQNRVRTIQSTLAIESKLTAYPFYKSDRD